MWAFEVLSRGGNVRSSSLVVRAWTLSSFRRNKISGSFFGGSKSASAPRPPLVALHSTYLQREEASQTTSIQKEEVVCPLSETTTATTIELARDDNLPANFVPHPFEYQYEVDMRIETLTNRGLGLGRVTLTPEQVTAMEQHNNQANDNKSDSGDGDSSKRSRRSRRKRKQAPREEGDESIVTVSIANDVDQVHANEEQQHQQQWVVMVPSVIPGELVRVRIFRNHRNYSEADLVQVLQASHDRVNPVCSLAGQCGGCQFQHMSIDLQRTWKTRFVQEALKQYGILGAAVDGVQPCLGTDQVYEYRSKLTPHYNAPSKSRRGRHNIMAATDDHDDNQNNSNSNRIKRIEAIGFQRQNSRQLVDVEHCSIATPPINDAYAQIRDRLLSPQGDGAPNPNRGATLLMRQANIADTHVETNPKAFMTTNVRGLDFTYRSNNFFQNNYYVLPLMVDHVVKEATAPLGVGTRAVDDVGDADSKRRTMTHLADCYCGSGLFALSCASHFEEVVGIEVSQTAIDEAKANARANQVANCQFLSASAENIFSVISHFPRNSTAVVLDPPRKGCSETFLEQLQAFAPARIVYMSCDPTTQARDVAQLVGQTPPATASSGNDDSPPPPPPLAPQYRMKSVQPFDLFPQTRHIECLTILERTDLCS